MLAGGVLVPADIEWLDGDVLSVDTAALTGEPIPRKYPDPHLENPLILAGTTVMAGEAYGIVRKTGEKTEAGAGQADIARDKAEVKVSVFEQRVLLVVQIVVGTSLVVIIIIILVQGFGRKGFKDSATVKAILLSALSIIVASIPIALPIVLQVTMALGAGKMAREFHAIVTSMPALQDISSMSVLCSDKTGTLTTAKIKIIADMTWSPPNSGFTKEDVALYAYLAANPDKKEDPIDRSVINHFASVFGSRGADLVKAYSPVRSVGFNPIYKRTVYEWTHPKLGKVIISKGIVSKMLNTEDGGVDDHEDQWKVDKYDEIKQLVNTKDKELSSAGYKTLGISMKVGTKPWLFVGILAQMDPPRVDSEITINALKNAGISVKMITGDHLNIAKETARKIGLGTDPTKTRIPNIQEGAIVRKFGGTAQLDQMVRDADGFAQVLPSDKREVVSVLAKQGLVVGMTGDGVNDAPALSRAQCGVAVHDATDAAKNAAAIILTSEGLSAIYAAVVESRRIFRKLKAYVTYRFAASIQIVTVLAFLILVSNCSIDPLYIILLALLNDLTMLPIAYDFQLASKDPENPDVNRILLTSLVLGLLETMFSLFFAYGAGEGYGKIFRDDYDYRMCNPLNIFVSDDARLKVEAAIFLQMFIAAEILIFSTRAPTYFFLSARPSWSLLGAVSAGCALMSLLVAVSSRFGKIHIYDILVIYLYNLIVFIIVDVAKVYLLRYFGESTEVLPDGDVIQEELKRRGITIVDGHVSEEVKTDSNVAMTPVGSGLRASLAVEADLRGSIMADRMTDWAIKNDDKYKGMSNSEARQSIADNIRQSTAARASTTSRHVKQVGHADFDEMRISTVRGLANSAGSDRPSLLGQPLRPNTPGSKFAR